MHKDRLCRYGMELMDWIFAKNHVRLADLADVRLTRSPGTEIAMALEAFFFGG